MKKGFLIFIAILISFYIYQFINTPSIAVEKDVRIYLEGCLKSIITKEFDRIYETYIVERQTSFDAFNEGMNYLSSIFGDPVSFFYLKSYIGGAGYFVQYNMTFENGEIHSCTFEFPITGKKQVIAKACLERFSISADFGKKQFTLFFKTGRILACWSPGDCFGEKN